MALLDVFSNIIWAHKGHTGRQSVSNMGQPEPWLPGCRKKSSKTSSGSDVLITSSLRRVFAVDGLTSFLMALSSGARNHKVGHDVVGTGAAGGVGFGVEGVEDRREGELFRPAGAETGEAHLRKSSCKERGPKVAIRRAARV